jgi:hypothetical protein
MMGQRDGLNLMRVDTSYDSTGAYRHICYVPGKTNRRKSGTRINA